MLTHNNLGINKVFLLTVQCFIANAKLTLFTHFQMVFIAHFWAENPLHYAFSPPSKYEPKILSPTKSLFRFDIYINKDDICFTLAYI